MIKMLFFSREWANSQRWTILHIFHVCDNLCGECGHYICSVFWAGFQPRRNVYFGILSFYQLVCLYTPLPCLLNH